MPRRKFLTTAICPADISAGTCPQSGNSTREADGFASSIVSATASGKTADRAPRSSSTGQVIRYQASQKKSPGMSHSMIGVTSKFSTVQLVSTSTSDV